MAASASAAPEPPWAAASGLGALRRERLLGYVEFEARDLARRFPPSISNGNKLLVAQIAAPKGADSVAEGLVRFARWRRVPLPPRFPDAGDLALAHVVGPFAYEPPREGESVWHLNFADTSLFGFYGGSLLAQDELQVAEHPLLASLREALHHRGEMSTAPRTRDGEEETPCLVMNAPRMCRFDLQPAPRLGLPYGIYGRAFAAATEAQVRALVARVEPPTSSNILAIVAPQGRGVYTAAQVSYVLSAAFSGFVAARAESERAAALERWPAAPRVTIHTGDWGAGAFGGDKLLMALLQLAAARLAQVDLAFHTIRPEPHVEQARALLRELLEATQGDTAKFIGAVVALGRRWGVSNGT